MYLARNVIHLQLYDRAGILSPEMEALCSPRITGSLSVHHFIEDTTNLLSVTVISLFIGIFAIMAARYMMQDKINILPCPPFQEIMLAS